MTAQTLQSGKRRGERVAEREGQILHMPRAVFDGVRAHGEETYPLECCGALLGRPEPEGWRVEAMLRAGNARTDSARDRYEIAAAELVQMAREARSRGLEIAGFYHSHPDDAARWSATDLAEAHWLGCVYAITEVAAGKAAATRAWRLAGTGEEDKRFEAMELRIEES